MVLINRKWSDIGLRALIASLAVTTALVLLDGYLRSIESQTTPTLYMITVWAAEFRGVFEQLIYASTIFFVGAKFFETRTILTIGFDKLDAGKMIVKGPDDDNIVWIGHRYGSRLEAESVSLALAERLKESV